jgi:hypothetical protein
MVAQHRSFHTLQDFRTQLKRIITGCGRRKRPKSSAKLTNEPKRSKKVQKNQKNAKKIAKRTERHGNEAAANRLVSHVG